MREFGTFEELHNEKGMEGWREGIQLQVSTSEVNRGQTPKSLRILLKILIVRTIGRY